MERQEREFTSEGARWRASVARRGASGHALVYFLPLEGEGVVEDDRRDRRAGLSPGRGLADLGADDLEGLLAEGTRLTSTERRFRAPDGRLWLAQNVGPVWAESDVAEGTTGLVFTSLEGPPERLTAADGHVGRMSTSGLSGRWRGARTEGRGDRDPELDGGPSGPDDH